ncbi:MAG: MFS transporter [Chlamydiae bacterium]|nr:MFS transporter [Chlamydiota bacterium]
MKKFLKQPSALWCAGIGGLGGFLLGYNTAIISGVLLVITEKFGLNTARQANIVSILLLGALAGAVAAGFISDKVGRKKTLLIAMAGYFLSSLLLTMTSNYGFFVFGRFLTGIACGIGTFIIPLYLSEIAPPKTRGAIVSINQFSVALGIFVAYLLNHFFDTNLNYRLVFGFSAIFSLAVGGFIYFLPESPSWLLAMMQRKEARLILRQVRPSEDADKIITQIEKHLMNASKDYYMKKIIVPSVITGLLLSIIHQICGFSSMIYYTPKILQSAGFLMVSSATKAAIAIGAMNLVCTAMAVYLVDKIGRKPLLIAGLCGMALMLLGLSIVNFFNPSYKSILTMIALLIYVGSFALSLGSIIFLMISEIFPLAVRGKVMALCIFVNFLFNYIVSLSFLPLFEKVSPQVCFLVFSILSSASIYYIYRYVPETKERALEDIEKFWKK